MAASTRFRRLFTSGGGYTLFMPVVVKVYTENETDPGIRLAIDYAINRFYALHNESFVFQTLDILGHVIMSPEIDGGWMAKNIFEMFVALRKGVHASMPDAAGIHDSNKSQEREALLISTAEEKPQAFIASLKLNKAAGRSQMIDLPEEYETKGFGIENIVRMLLTVVSDRLNPGSDAPFDATIRRLHMTLQYCEPNNLFVCFCT